MATSMKPAAEQAPTRAAARVAYFDGLRGWAALVVVLFHTTWEIFGEYAPMIRVNALGVFTDGLLAVFVFFVLSGAVLSRGYLRAGDPWPLVRLALGRYPRLTIPVAAASLIGLLMMECGLFFNHEAAQVVGRADWLGLFYGQEPSLGGWLRFALFDVYFDHHPLRSYDVFLWTMPIELIGSFALFGFLLTTGRHAAVRRITYPFLLAAGWHFCPFYLPFLYGVMVADLTTAPALAPFRGGRGSSILGSCLVILACTCCPLLHHRGEPHASGVLAFALVLGVSLSRPLQLILQGSLSEWLGKVSFPLYLVHSFVICGPGCLLILDLNAMGVHGAWLVTVSVIAMVVMSLAAAQLFLPVEMMAKRAAGAAASAMEPLLRRRSRVQRKGTTAQTSGADASDIRPISELADLPALQAQ